MTEVICTFSHQLEGWLTIDEQARCPHFQPSKSVSSYAMKKSISTFNCLMQFVSVFFKGSFLFFCFLFCIFICLLVFLSCCWRFGFRLIFRCIFLGPVSGFLCRLENKSVSESAQKRKKTNKRQLHGQQIIFTFCCFLAFSFPLPEWNKQTNKQTKLMSHQKAYTNDIS